ncbi:hypothetical protein BH20ACT18_BH20ACT18_11160 [soil metagenome]
MPHPPSESWRRLAIELGLAERALSELPGHFDVRPLEITAIALFGAVAGARVWQSAP